MVKHWWENIRNMPIVSNNVLFGQIGRFDKFLVVSKKTGSKTKSTRKFWSFGGAGGFKGSTHMHPTFARNATYQWTYQMNSETIRMHDRSSGCGPHLYLASPETAGAWMLKLHDTAFLLQVDRPFAKCLHTTPHGITTTTATTISSESTLNYGTGIHGD